MKLDRQKAQYRPTVYQNRGRGHIQRQNNYEYRNRSYSQDRNQSYSRGRGNFHSITEAIGPIIETEMDQEITGMEIAIEETIIPKAIEEIIIHMIMVIKGTGI